MVFCLLGPLGNGQFGSLVLWVFVSLGPLGPSDPLDPVGPWVVWFIWVLGLLVLLGLLVPWTSGSLVLWVLGVLQVLQSPRSLVVGVGVGGCMCVYVLWWRLFSSGSVFKFKTFRV